MHDSYGIPKAIPMFSGSGSVTILLRRLLDVWIRVNSKIATFNPQYNWRTTKFQRLCSSYLLFFYFIFRGWAQYTWSSDVRMQQGLKLCFWHTVLTLVNVRWAFDFEVSSHLSGGLLLREVQLSGCSPVRVYDNCPVPLLPHLYTYR